MKQAIVVKEPLTREVCKGCGRPIYRNLALFDGDPYHWGCLKKTHAKPSYQCLDCGAFLSGAGVVKILFDDTNAVEKSCPYCGSSELKRLSRAPWLKLPLTPKTGDMRDIRDTKKEGTRHD